MSAVEKIKKLIEAKREFLARCGEDYDGVVNITVGSDVLEELIKAKPNSEKWIVGNNKVDIHSADSEFRPIATFMRGSDAEAVVKLWNKHGN